MHIMEGFLPVEHALGWTAASAPFVALGIRSVRRQLREQPDRAADHVVDVDGAGHERAHVG